jgi:hypothetical protein
MAKPLYIVCCQLSVEDRATNCVSLFNVIEKLAYSRMPLPGVPPLQLHIVSVWLQEPQDSEKEFEWYVKLRFLPTNSEMQLGADKLKFENPIRRITARVVGTPPQILGSNEIIAQAAMRPVGDEKWAFHEFNIAVEEMPQPTPSPSAN